MRDQKWANLASDHINHEKARFVGRATEIGNADRITQPYGGFVAGQFAMRDETKPIIIDSRQRRRRHDGQRSGSSHKLSTVHNHPAINLQIDSGFNLDSVYTKKNQFSVKKGPTRMKATIWHNPNCGTSRKTLAILDETDGVELTVIEYLKTPPTAEKLGALYRQAGMTPRQGLRTRGSPAEELGLLEADAEAILAAMAKDPTLIERPLVETEKGVRLCRPQDIVREIL